MFKYNKAGIFGILIISFFIIIALFAPYIAPYDPYKRVAPPMIQPDSNHILGTNDIGQDIFSELVWGARVSLMIGFAVAIVVMIIGTTVGIIAGYFGGIIDEVLMRFADLILILPGIPLMIIIAALLGSHSLGVIILTMSITGWGGLSRMVRSVTLSLKERTFIEASKALGAGNKRIMFKHILPNIAPLIFSSVIYRLWCLCLIPHMNMVYDNIVHFRSIRLKIQHMPEFIAYLNRICSIIIINWYCGNKLFVLC